LEGCCVLFAVLFLPASASALDPDRHISQYGHTAWRLQDGVFAGAPQAMAQTADGYLWIGTASGLIRFDGVRFVPWAFPPNETLMSSVVSALLGDQDGSLWIGTGGGLSHWKDGHLLNYRQNRGRINTLRQDSQGTIWLVRSRPQDDNGPFCRVEGESIKCYGKTKGINFPWAQELVSDRHGGFWIGAASGLCHWTPEGVSNFFPERLKGSSGQTTGTLFRCWLVLPCDLSIERDPANL
jgi:ligand-binding sensor domain-containing protein